MPPALPSQFVVILGTLLLIVGGGLTVARNLSGRTVGEYFFAGGLIPRALLATLLFVTMLWGMMLVIEATPVTISQSDLVIIILSVAGGLAFLGWLFGPSLKSSGSMSLASHVASAYGRSVGLLIALVWVCFVVLITIPCTILVGTRLLHVSLEWDVMQSGLLLVVLPGILVVTRGYVAVLITHTVAGFLAVAVIVAGLLFGLPQWLDGTLWDSSLEALSPSVVIAGSMILSLWFSCADQVSAHHAIAARSSGAVRSGSFLAAIVLVVVSLIAVNFSIERTPTFLSVHADFMTVLIGTTVLFLVVAALSSQFMTVATLIALNLYQLFRPGKDEGSIVLVGRTAATIVVIAAILAGTAVGLGGFERVDWLVRALATGVPPITAIVLIGGLWHRARGRGAFWALIIGWGVGAVQSMIMAESISSVIIGMVTTFAVSASVLLVMTIMVSREQVYRELSDTLAPKGLQSPKS